MAIPSIGPASIGPLQESIKPQQPVKQNTDFGQVLMSALDNVSNAETTADQLALKMASNQDVDLHQVVLAMEESNLKMQMAIQVRNKVIEAYQDIMRMPV